MHKSCLTATSRAFKEQRYFVAVGFLCYIYLIGLGEIEGLCFNKMVLQALLEIYHIPSVILDENIRTIIGFSTLP